MMQILLVSSKNFKFVTLHCIAYFPYISDAQEEYQIKSVCISAVLELLISCKMYPNVGDRLNSLFHHVPRLERLKADTIR